MASSVGPHHVNCSKLFLRIPNWRSNTLFTTPCTDPKSSQSARHRYCRQSLWWELLGKHLEREVSWFDYRQGGGGHGEKRISRGPKLGNKSHPVTLCDII